MKNFELFKTASVFITFLIPLFLFPQDDLNTYEKLPLNSEKLDVIFQNNELLNVPITLFNKTTSKVKVGNYSDAKIKKNSPSESTTKILGITYIETKFKYSIEFNNSVNETSKFTGTKTTSNALETIKASITANLGNSETWDFLLRIDKIDFLNIDFGRLTKGRRTIKVIRTNYHRFNNIIESSEITPETVFYEFIEDGISLGAVAFDNQNSIWLKPGLDATTKLILCTAMLSIAN